MSRCLEARIVTVALRRGRETKEFDVVCPGQWSKSTFLDYVRSEHPRNTVRILNWPIQTTWEPRYWMVNPEGFRDFKRGVVDAELRRVR